VQCVHREFSYKSPGERILKIGPHLPKLLSTIKGLSFFLEHGVYNYYLMWHYNWIASAS